MVRIVGADGRVIDVAAEAVVFDKDGTLVDLGALWAGPAVAWIDRVAAAAGGAAPSSVVAAELRAAVGITPDGQLEPNSPAATATLDEVTALVVARLDRLGVRNGRAAVARAGRADPDEAVELGRVVPVGDVAGTLRRLRRAGIAVAVATSDDRGSALAHLHALGVTDLVQAVVCGDDDLVPPKPSPRVLAHLGHRLGVEPARMVMVGDSTTDVATAANGGAACCVGVTGGGGRPDGADVLVTSVEAIAPGR